MTTLAEARERIYDEFITAWGATSDLTLDNEKFDPPSDSPWARLSIRHNGRDQESLGPVTGRKFESIGSVFVQCFSPLDGGRTAADTLAATAQSILEGKHLHPEGIRLTGAAITEIGASEGWYQINVEALFTYSETK